MIDTSKLECIAFATSQPAGEALFPAPGGTRWTELSIAFRPGERRPFVAESFGKSTVPGEREFHRQRAGRSIEEVSRLFDNSRLADAIAEQVDEWSRLNPDKVQQGQPAPRIAWDGKDGLRGALLWLYADTINAELTTNGLAKLFEFDWGVPGRTVTHALNQERDGEGLPSWCKAFLGALQHFDREAFLAARRVG